MARNGGRLRFKGADLLDRRYDVSRGMNISSPRSSTGCGRLFSLLPPPCSPRSELSNFTRVARSARLNSRASFKIRTGPRLDGRVLFGQAPRTTCRSPITRERIDRMRMHIRNPIKTDACSSARVPIGKKGTWFPAGCRKPGTRYVTGVPGRKITRLRVLPFLSHVCTNIRTWLLHRAHSNAIPPRGRYSCVSLSSRPASFIASGIPSEI